MSNSTFASKLDLTLKAMSMSRGQMASAIGVDKSVIGRWISGRVAPSGHNLTRLTQVIAGRRVAFSLLNWELDDDAFAISLGLSSAAVPLPGQMTLPLATSGLRDADRDAGAFYSGIWRITTSAGVAEQPDLFLHGYSIVTPHPDGYLCSRASMYDFHVEGWAMPVGNQLFSAMTELSTGRMMFNIMNGVVGDKSHVMDGIGLNCRGELGGLILSWGCVMERIADLSSEPEADLAHFHALAKQPAIAEPGSVPPEIRERLLPELGPKAAAAGGELLLIMPALRSLARGAA
jgi:transcriptional regulator with XRE-family HTH domain